MAAFLKVKLHHSAIARDQRQKDTLRGLGLRHLQQVKILKDTPEIRGMINKVVHLVDWEETSDREVSRPEKVETYRLGAKGVAKPAKAKSKAKAAEPKQAAAKAKAPKTEKATPAKAKKAAAKAPAAKKAAKGGSKKKS